MTPNAKQKSIELVEKYKPYVYCYMGSGMLTNTEDESVILMNAKSCALMCVEEIIKDHNDVGTPDGNKRYWLNVKSEIEKL